LAVLILIYFLTNLFTEMNSAAVVMMFPITMETAAQVGANQWLRCDRGWRCLIEFCDAHRDQTNLIVYGPGGYNSRIMQKSSFR
jgi:di/tricarboxylate transporter